MKKKLNGKEMLKKLTAGLLTAGMILTMAGCGSSTPEAGEAGTTSGSKEAGGSASEELAAAEYKGEADLEYVELQLYAIADAPYNTDLAKEYWNQLNKKLKEDLNCTINFTYAAGNDYKNNYALAVTSGEKYDLMQAAPGWLDYQSYAAKNAFMPLDELLPEYAPYLWENIPQSTWEAASVNGHIYAVPTMETGVTACAFVYREDLRKKHNLPEIDSMEDVETYLQGIKDNEPEILPSDDYQCQVYGTSWIYNTPYIGIDEIHDRIFNFVYDPRNGEVLSVIETPEYIEWMHKMKDWADRGFWSSSVLSSTNWGVMQVLNGAAAASFNEQLPGYNYHATQVAQEHAEEGWELGYYMYFEGNEESVLSGSTTGSLTAVAATAQNPERALMFLDYVQQNEELWDFITYGMEGINYHKMDDGSIDTTNIEEGAAFNYFPSNMVLNENFKKLKGNEWSEYDSMMEKINAKLVPDIFEGFVLDKSSFETEYTALYNVQTEYGYPLQAGLVADVDAAYEKYLAAAKAAGLDEVRAEVEKQVNEWLNSK